MNKNVGSADKWVRIGIGLVILILGIIFGSWWSIAGVILMVTGSMGRCPLYIPCGLSTCKIDSKPEQK